jgi:ATP-dependent Zn protease
MPWIESSRISIKMRGNSLGHHQAFEKEERFGKFQSKMFAELLHIAGAMAAELAFYGENSNGVGGDMQQTTWTATTMVGAAGMSPMPVDLHGKTFPDENEEQSRERVVRRFEDLGYRMMNRTAAGWDANMDPRKRAYAAQFMGEALVTTYNLMVANKDKIQAIADAVVDKKEIYGDDLLRLLDAQNLVKPEIDWTDEKSWPVVMNWSKDPRERHRDRDGRGDFEGMQA